MAKRRSWLWLLVVASWLTWPTVSTAQSLNASAGTSSFLDASGFQFDYKWQPVSGWMGIGVSEGTHFGGFLGATYRGFNVGAGDRYYPFILDTDVFDKSYLFYGRGVSLGHRDDKQQWLVFAGSTAQPFMTPFLRAYEADRATGAFFYERRLPSSVTFHSYNLFGDNVTSIQSVGITLRPKWRVATAAGVGAGSGYFSAATQYAYKWLSVTSSYTANGDRFRRLRVANFLYPERTSGNVQVQLTPLSNLGLQLNHATVFSPTLGLQKPLRATLDSANLHTSLQGFSLNFGLSESRGGPFFTTTKMFTATRNIGTRLTSFGAIMRIRTQASRPSDLYLLTGEEKLTRRFSLRQTFTRSAGTNTMGWGGRFLSNPISLGIDYQTVFNPVAGGFNGHPFVQAWTVNAQLHLPRGVSFHYDTFLDPFGKFRYTAYLTGLRYSRAPEILGMAPTTPPTSLGRYIIKGSVVDEGGKPVWGIAVQIDGQSAYSDSSGQFFLRVNRRGEYPLSVASERVLNPGHWEVVRAPQTVLAAPPDSAKAVVIVVRKRTVPTGALPASSASQNP